MPKVRYVGGATYALRTGPTWEDGDSHDVDAKTADRLCDDWRFERVDDGDDGDDMAGYLRDEPPDVQIGEGVCPWCPPDDRYEGDHVGQHASSAHPDEWADYTEDN
jgi:hypothetical protein